MDEAIHNVKVIHLAAKPDVDHTQNCLLCGKLLSVGAKTYMEGEEVFEERSTKSRVLSKRGYIRCTELS